MGTAALGCPLNAARHFLSGATIDRFATAPQPSQFRLAIHPLPGVTFRDPLGKFQARSFNSLPKFTHSLRLFRMRKKMKALLVQCPATSPWVPRRQWEPPSVALA